MKVHPLVIFSILNSYMRRNEKHGRVIGTLLGTVKDDEIEVSKTHHPCKYIQNIY